MRRFERWAITVWSAVGLLAMTGAILGVIGWGEEGIRTVVRGTARTSVTLFLLAFLASSLRKLFPRAWTDWLLRNRPYLVVAFAESHFLHLAVLVTLGLTFPDPFLREIDSITIVGGGLAYLFIVVLVITSFGRAANWAGHLPWKLLPLVGSYYIWAIFTQAFALRALENLLYVPIALALLAGLVLQVTVSLCRREGATA